jgi:hypothetical protein
VLKLEIKGESAIRFSNFSKLKAYLRKDGIVMFGANTKHTRELFIGGAMKPSELRNAHQRIKTIRVVPSCLGAFRNTRSYKLIIDEILNMESMQR